MGPICARPGCRRSVRMDRDTGEWCTYCSRSCVGKMRQSTGVLAERRRQRTVAFHARAIRAAVGEDWRDGDPVTLQQLIALSRTAYRQGWHTRHMHYVQRTKRGQVAA